MPLYEYRCQACGDTFETIRGINDKDADVACPICGEKKAEKLMSACCCVTKGDSSPASASSCGPSKFT
jgi:putative FmdB family regulatory protein